MCGAAFRDFSVDGRFLPISSAEIDGGGEQSKKETFSERENDKDDDDGDGEDGRCVRLWGRVGGNGANAWGGEWGMGRNKNMTDCRGKSKNPKRRLARPPFIAAARAPRSLESAELVSPLSHSVSISRPQPPSSPLPFPPLLGRGRSRL